MRPLNYLRVKNEYATRYNWLYPSFLCLVLFSSVIVGTDRGSPTEVLSSIDRYSALLTVLFPFYFASLAAISSLGGVPALDKKFEMSHPVTLVIKVTRLEYDTLHLSPRDFISLLFAYCTTMSLLLLVTSFILPGIFVLVDMIPVFQNLISLVFLFVITFMFSQLLLTTLLGVYFLSDYMVRNRRSAH